MCSPIYVPQRYARALESAPPPPELLRPEIFLHAEEHGEAGHILADEAGVLFHACAATAQTDQDSFHYLPANGFESSCPQPGDQMPGVVFQQFLAKLPVAGQKEPVLPHEHHPSVQPGRLHAGR